ncbi:MAG: hypothetical protein HQK55_04780 [Deltaproteobacteria bacterium]|nr:hypothetical protein [Deltaproteobacteria bacterium]
MYKCYGSKIDRDSSIQDYNPPDLLSGQPSPPQGGLAEHIFIKFDNRDQDIVQTLAEAEQKAAEILAEARTSAELHLKKNKAEAEMIRTSAEEMKARLTAEATSLREDASRIKQEAEQIRERSAAEGREQGHKEGWLAGQEEGRPPFLADISPVLTALQRVENLYPDLRQVNEVTLVKLATKIAERIALQEISMEPEYVQTAFKAGIENLHEQHQAKFRIHPDDLTHVEAAREALKDQLPGLLKIIFEPDANLTRGDLIMETEAGRLDATVKRRIEAVTSSVDEALTMRFNLDW